MVHQAQIAHNLRMKTYTRCKIKTHATHVGKIGTLFCMLSYRELFMTMPIEKRNDCILLKVRIIPKADRNKIMGLHDSMLKVLVTAVPEKGKANAALIKFIAKTLGIAKTSVQLVAGETARNKILSLPVDADLSSLKEFIPDI